MQEILENLKVHGFTEYEAKAYVALVGLGMATAREICEIAAFLRGGSTISSSCLQQRDLSGYRKETRHSIERKILSFLQFIEE